MPLNRYIDVGQIRSVSHQRILGLVGVLESEYWKSIQISLNLVLDFQV
jgi:mRNA interferase MazF